MRVGSCVTVGLGLIVGDMVMVGECVMVGAGVVGIMVIVGAAVGVSVSFFSVGLILMVGATDGSSVWSVGSGVKSVWPPFTASIRGRFWLCRSSSVAKSFRFPASMISAGSVTN